MTQLLASIQQNGVMSPVMVRPREEGGFEIITGHRRTEACRTLKMPTVPCFICNMDDDTAILAMVDTNIAQRSGIPVSERAFALKMRAEAVKRLMAAGKVRPEIKRASEGVSQEIGLSARQVHRLLKLTKLNRNFLDMMDAGKINIDLGGQLANLTTEEQCWVYDLMKEKGIMVKIPQVKQLYELSIRNELTQEKVEEILTAKKAARKPVLAQAPLPEPEEAPAAPAPEPTPEPAPIPDPIPEPLIQEKAIASEERQKLAEKSLPTLDYARISRYYPPGTTVEHMNNDICHLLEVARRQRLYGY